MRARLLACTLAALTLAASTLLAPDARGALPAQMPDGTVPTLAPVIAAAVAMMSVRQIVWSDVLSGLILPGQWAIKGTR